MHTVAPIEAERLYVGAPFKVNLRHAKHFARRVIIMSARYGLLDLTDEVEYYEAYLPDLDVRDQWFLRQRMKDQFVLKRLQRALTAGCQFVSYLPKAYQQALEDAIPWLPTSRPYAGLNMLQMIKQLNKEFKDAQHSAGR